jgi:ATP-dependent protease ClpP protease subunit
MRDYTRDFKLDKTMWDEGKHPRDERGRFAFSAGANAAHDKALNDYEDNYSYVRDYLKDMQADGSYPKEWGGPDEELDDVIKRMDDLINAHEVDKDTVGYEFASRETGDLMKVGDIFHDPAYLHLHTDPSRYTNPDGTARKLRDHDVNVVHLPKGTKAVKVNDNEIIVHRNSATSLGTKDDGKGFQHSYYEPGGYRGSDPGTGRLETADDYKKRRSSSPNARSSKVTMMKNEITLSGPVGMCFEGEGGFTHATVIEALSKFGRNSDVTVRLNSGGGIATDGAAIHAVLSAHKGKVTIVIEGVAASAASLIAMAGDEILMAKGAMMMIHDPATITFGNADDHQKAIDTLNKLSNNYAVLYAERSGKSAKKIRELMKAETWMTAEEAIKAGFASGMVSDNDNSIVEIAAFAFSAYAKTPQPIVALAKARGWTSLQQQKEIKMAGFPPKKDDTKKKPADGGGDAPPADDPNAGAPGQDTAAGGAADEADPNAKPNDPNADPAQSGGTYVLTTDEVEQIVNILANSGENDENLQEIIKDLQGAQSVTISFNEADRAPGEMDPNKPDANAPPQVGKGEDTAKGAPPSDAPSDAPAPKKEDDPKKKPTAAADIADICMAAGIPALASQLIREEATIEEATARVEMAKSIKSMVADARQINPAAIDANAADEFIAQGRTADQVREALFSKIVAKQSPEVSPALAGDTKPKATAETTSAWDRAVSNHNARLK